MVRLRKLRKRDQNAVLAQDSALFGRDFSDGVAQVVLVVERNVRDDAEQRVDDVGGIEAAAQAYFKHEDFGGGPHCGFIVVRTRGYLRSANG